MRKRNWGRTLLGVAAGALAGAVTGFVVAPFVAALALEVLLPEGHLFLKDSSSFWPAVHGCGAGIGSVTCALSFAYFWGRERIASRGKGN